MLSSIRTRVSHVIDAAIRERPASPQVIQPGRAIRLAGVRYLAEAQEDAQADEFISVKLLDSDGNTTGDAFDAEGLMANASSLTALDEASPLIKQYDIIPVFKARDGKWYIDEIFAAAGQQSEEVIAVKAKESAAARSYISCMKVTWNTGSSSWDEVGSAFNVYALFCNSGSFSNLDTATPRIVIGDILFAKQMESDRYFFVSQFDGDEDCDCYSAT